MKKRIPNLPSQAALAMQLVTLHSRKATTTSLIVAEVFERQHRNVLQSIERIECSDEFAQLNFQLSEYMDSTGRKLPMYNITRDGFSFLAMGFSGKRAAQFKEQFIRAFNMMEQTLLNQQNLFWQEERQANKIGRRGEADTILLFVEYAGRQGSANAKNYFIAFTNMTYRALFCSCAANPPPLRDMLDGMQLSFLSTAEYLVDAALKEGMQQGIYYKDIYQRVRDRVIVYAQQLPKDRLGRGQVQLY